MATKADLESFVTKVTCPNDFDILLGKGVRSELDAMPLEATCEPDSVSQHGRPCRCTRRGYRSLGRAGNLRLVRAAGREGDGPFPAILHLPGYKSEPALRRDWGARGVAVLSVAVQGQAAQQRRFQPRVSRPP